LVHKKTREVKKISKMVGTQPLIDIVSLTLQSAFVGDRLDGYRPASLMLIAKPESGKTSSISQFKKLRFVKYIDEITVKTLIDNIFPTIRSGETKFILIPDILNCVEKSTYTRQPLLNTLKSLVDEGVTEILTPHKRYEFGGTPIKAGLISAITRSSLYALQGRYSLFQDIKRMGFMSRMIPFSYEYPINKVINIFRYIEGGAPPKDETITIPKIKVRKKIVEYEPDPNLFSDLRTISTKLGGISDAYGIRCQKNLQKLCYANALMNGRKTVDRDDVDRVIQLAKWMNFDFNSL